MSKAAFVRSPSTTADPAASAVSPPRPTESACGALTLFGAPLIPAHAERAHEMKNCLSVVIAIARLLDSEVSPRGRERLERLRTASVRLHALVDENLCATPSVERTCERRDATCVASLVRDVIGGLTDRAEQSRVHLAADCAGGRLVGDEESLKEALFNLVANAIEATPAGGRVLVATEVTPEADQVWTVRDTGGGMPKEQLSSLGQPFVSGRLGGSGIGLAFVRKVVAEHGGLLRVESVLGSGTIVSVWLPREGGSSSL